MLLAADARLELLRIAQLAALEYASARGSVTSDDVAWRMMMNGHDYESLGNASGSVFRSKAFEWRGVVIKSARVSTHSRMIRVWHLREMKGKE
jgi:hypothetical protein